MEARFGKLRSENKVKNFWYSKRFDRINRSRKVAVCSSSSRNSINKSNISYLMNDVSHYINTPLIQPLPTIESKFQPNFPLLPTRI
jgi:hypothetical protein